MQALRPTGLHIVPRFLPLLSLLMLAGLALALVNCGGGSVQVTSNPPQGTISVSLSDPPSCTPPAGNFKHVFISVRSVQAHLSSTANDGTPGWQELAPQLVSHPLQIDLLGAPQLNCILAMLGTNTPLPVGDYQQFRLLLVLNTAGASDPVPSPNACGSQGLNCVVLTDNSVHELLLSSQANTGLKVPPGQVLGGPIRVQAGQHVDLNIDFNACNSIVPQGNGEFRLNPVLTAGVVSPNTTGLSGQVVDKNTGQPVSGGVVKVALEQPDSGNVDRIIMEKTVDSSGNFSFCPLPAGMFDVVVVAINGAGTAYNATAILNVPNGTALGKIPLVPETGSGSAAGPGTIQGTVTSTTGSAGIAVDVRLSALEAVSPSGGGTRQITLPVQGSATPNVTTASGGTCPVNTFCVTYTLIVPASNPSFGTFSASGTTLSTPASGDVLHSVEAKAFKPSSGGATSCSPDTQTVDKDSANAPLKVTGGTTTTAKQIDFTGCT